MKTELKSKEIMRTSLFLGMVLIANSIRGLSQQLNSHSIWFLGSALVLFAIADTIDVFKKIRKED